MDKGLRAGAEGGPAQLLPAVGQPVPPVLACGGLLVAGRIAKEAGAGGCSKDAELDTLRLRLVKIGGRVRQLLTLVRMHLASSHPGQRLWRLLDESRQQARE